MNEVEQKPALTKTDLPIKLFSRGKVRDTYVLDDKALLMISTDRISAFDVVFNEGIPYKGVVLNQMSLFWFKFLNGVENHLISSSVPSRLKNYDEQIEHRSMQVKIAKPFEFECVVRGYLAGSGWKEYKQTGKVCGIELPSNLQESSKLPELIFTPATKAQTGHDINVSFDAVVEKLGIETATKLRDLSLSIYKKAADYAETRGIIIADTKFEFGLHEGRIILIDEVLTPDSSRFWPAGKYAPGRPQDSFDKQYVRDYLEGTGWNKSPPPPALPENIIKGTSERYMEAYALLTGKKFSFY